MKLPLLLGCLLVTAKAGNNRGSQRTSLEDIERDYTSGDARTSKQANSPTKYGFVPQRTASSYAAVKPKYQYSQTNYQVKKSTPKTKPAVQYVEQPVYYSQPQYLTAQPQQYENVQYVTDNSIAQPEQPQYYFVQQYQAPSTAVEAVIDPKDILSYFTPNSIGSTEEKYLQPYYVKSEQSLPPVTTSTKYTSAQPTKSTTKAKQVKYVPVPETQYQQQQQQQQEIIIKRTPKSLLDSYVPSVVQLQYLKQHGKLGYSKF